MVSSKKTDSNQYWRKYIYHCLAGSRTWSFPEDLVLMLTEDEEQRWPHKGMSLMLQFSSLEHNGHKKGIFYVYLHCLHVKNKGLLSEWLWLEGLRLCWEPLNCKFCGNSELTITKDGCWLNRDVILGAGFERFSFHLLM